MHQGPFYCANDHQFQLLAPFVFHDDLKKSRRMNDKLSSRWSPENIYWTHFFLIFYLPGHYLKFQNTKSILGPHKLLWGYASITEWSRYSRVMPELRLWHSLTNLIGKKVKHFFYFSQSSFFTNLFIIIFIIETYFNW